MASILWQAVLFLHSLNASSATSFIRITKPLAIRTQSCTHVAKRNDLQYAVLFLHSLNASSATSFVQETELLSTAEIVTQFYACIH